MYKSSTSSPKDIRGISLSLSFDIHQRNAAIQTAHFQPRPTTWGVGTTRPASNDMANRAEKTQNAVIKLWLLASSSPIHCLSYDILLSKPCVVCATVCPGAICNPEPVQASSSGIPSVQRKASTSLRELKLPNHQWL